MKKALLITLVCFLTLYAPIELTRVIIVWGLTAKFVIEISVIWVLYLGAIAILTKVVRV